MTGLRALVRIGLRSILRYPARSLLVIALIAITVAAGTLAAIANRTTSVSVDDLARAELGGADFVARFGTTNVQFGDGLGPQPIPVAIGVPGGVAIASRAQTDDELERAVAEQRAWLDEFDVDAFEQQVESRLDLDVATARRGLSRGNSEALGPFGFGNRGSRVVIEFDVDDPKNSGVVDLQRGRFPTASNEVATAVGGVVDPDVVLGENIEIAGEELVLVGVVTNPISRFQPVAVVTSETFDRLVDPDAGIVFEVRADLTRGNTQRDDVVDAIELATARPIWARTDTAILTQNGGWDSGALDFAYRSSVNTRFDARTPLPYLISSILAIQVVLVAAAAFAVGIRRRMREFGQLLALGADDRHVRKLVLTEAGLLGAVGALVGLAVGVSAAWLATSQGWLNSAGERIPTGVRFTVTDWLGPAVIGVAAALVAAWWPARSIASASIPSTIAGNPPLVRLRKGTSKWGVVVAAIGVVLVAGAARDITNYESYSNRSGYLLLVAGIGTLLIGTIMLIGSILSFIGSRADRLPLLARLVARNSDRQRSRSWVVVGSFIVALVVPILVGSSIKAYPNSYNTNRISEVNNRMLVVRQQLFGFPGEDVGGLPAEHVELDSSLDDVFRQAGSFRQLPMVVAPDLRLQLSSGTVSYGFGNTVLIATDEMLDFFNIDAETRQRLGDETVLDLSVHSSLSGSGQFSYGSSATQTNRGLSMIRNSNVPVRGQPVEYLAGPPLFRTDTFAITEATAEKFLVEPTRVGTIRVFDAPVSFDTERELRAAADMVWVERFGEYDRGNFSPLAPGDSPDPALDLSITRTSTQGLSAVQAQWVALAVSLGLAVLVALVTSSLTAVEMDTEVASMIATGAAPVMRRKLLGAQTLYHLLIAAALAIPAGVLLFYAASSADDFGPRGITIPWTAIGLTTIIVPAAVAAVIALTFRNGRPAVSRRLS